MRNLVKEVEQKKRSLIKSILYIALFLLSFVSFGQDKKPAVWKNEKEYLEYQKKKKYEGPEDWYGSYPSNLRDEEGDKVSGYNNGSSYNQNNYGSGGSQGIQYTPQQIQKDRQKRYRTNQQDGGKLPFDPAVKDPDPIELPDIDAPDIDLPDVDLPNIDAPTIPPGVWKVIMFIIIAAALLIIVYLILKNKKAPNKKVVVDVENDWNPEVVTKTELELRLEAAMEDEDFRECVRIYFTFILKELIHKSWISWKKEKTNYHYVLEMHKRENAAHFNECVRIYDLVWYGDYDIDKEMFELLQPSFENYYKSLNPVNE